MREWQVGDPIGLGDDAGVPDIPYMGYLKDNKDDDEKRTLDEAIDDILYYVYASDEQKLKLHDDIKRILLSARSCRLIDVDSTCERTEFLFKQENRFVWTTHEYLFYPDHPFPNFSSFYDIIERNSYAGLEAMESFKAMISAKERELGKKFIGCGGGYRKKDLAGIELSDECRIFANFESDTPFAIILEIDLENMKLKE